MKQGRNEYSLGLDGDCLAPQATQLQFDLWDGWLCGNRRLLLGFKLRHLARGHSRGPHLDLELWLAARSVGAASRSRTARDLPLLLSLLCPVKVLVLLLL